MNKFGVSIEVNLHHFQDNFSLVKTFAPKSKRLAMIKANAYGHGLVSCAKALPDADAFGVARLFEAKKLRDAGITQPIVLMAGFFTEEQLFRAVELECDLVIHEKWQLAHLEKLPPSVSMRIWLKVNTGMNRLGISTDDVTFAYSALEKIKAVKEIILMTHFSDADDPSNPKTLKQLEAFKVATRSLSCEKSLANSAAIIAFPESHFDWVRPGIMLYGSSPLVGKTGEEHELKPVMTVKSHVIAIRDQLPGDEIGYGSRYICDKPMRVGIVALGYGDGYPRHANENTPVLIQGKRTNLIGRVSMDMLAVDLSNIETNIGDEVILWGAGLPAEAVANSVDTITYELFTHIAPRKESVSFLA